MNELVAGAHAVPIPMPIGGPMMGYGARGEGARSLHDPLQARALYLRGAQDCLIVSCDVCLVAPSQADAARERLARETSVPIDRILFASIHTHSGPDTGFGELMAGRPAPDAVAGVFDAAFEAGREAVRRAEPARLGVAHGQARIGRNRRRADGPLDPDVRVLRVDRASGGTIAVLYSHGCHPTALGHDNLAYSADWPWAAGLEIRDAFPEACVIFLLAAHADVDPRTRGLQDLAIPNQSVGVGFDETEVLGREVGAAVVEAAREAPLQRRVRVAAARTHVRVPTHRPDPDAERLAREALGLSADEPVRTADFFHLERERTAGLPIEERRERVARVRSHLRGRLASRFAFGADPEVEVQVLQIGPLRLLALPLEATIDVGRDWQDRIGGSDASVVSIGNGWIRYLPHRKNFDEPNAHHSYEVLMSSLVPEASDRLLDAGVRLDRQLEEEHTIR